jgi:hypothetical protein
MTPVSATHRPPFLAAAGTMRTAAVMAASVVTTVINQLDIGGIAVNGVHHFQLIENARPAWHAG